MCPINHCSYVRLHINYADACDCTRGLNEHRGRESALKNLNREKNLGEKSLAASGTGTRFSIAPGMSVERCANWAIPAFRLFTFVFLFLVYYIDIYIIYWSLLYSAILRSWADSLQSHVILHEWIAFYSAFLNIHRSSVLTVSTQSGTL